MFSFLGKNDKKQVEVLQENKQTTNTTTNQVSAVSSNAQTPLANNSVTQQVNNQQIQQINPTNPMATNIDASNVTSQVQSTVSTVMDTHREKIARPLNGYRYTIINDNGKKENGTFEAESADDVRHFMSSMDFQVLEVKERGKLDIDLGASKFHASDLSFSLTQLSTYIKAGIPLADSVRILAKQSKKPGIKKSFYQLVYQLLKGESLSDAMAMQSKVYPKLLINMVKTAEMTGDLPSILDDMAEYYTSMEQTRKQMKSAMTYPIVVLTIAFGVLIFMLTYLVPQFSALFESNGAELPALTKFIVGVSDFINSINNYLFCYRKR